MHVTAEYDGDPAHRDGQWTTTARVTVRMTDAEYQAIDGLRYEAFPWIRFRLRLHKDPQGPGAWRYEVHDCQRYTDEDPVVRSGARPPWGNALAAGLDELRDARQAARQGTAGCGDAHPRTGACR
jgi:hypothetical protein